jgi:oligosaccharide repeat unit polymerase
MKSIPINDLKRFRAADKVVLLIIVVELILALIMFIPNKDINSAIILTLTTGYFIALGALDMGKMDYQAHGYLTPSNIFSIVFLIMYFVMGFDLLFVRDYFRSSDLLNLYLKAILIANFAFLSFWLGYKSLIGIKLSRLLPRFKFTWHQGRYTFVIVAILFISWLAFFILIRESGGFFDQVTQLSKRTVLFSGKGYLILLVNLSHLSLYLSILYWLDNKKGLPVFIFSIITSAIMLLSLGSRVEIFVVVLMLMIIYTEKRKKISTTLLTLGILLLLIFAVFYGSYTRNLLPYGSWVGDSLSTSQTISEDLKIVWDELAPLNFDSLSRLIFILDKIPERYDYLYGKAYLGLLSYPLPRTIFPDKFLGIGTLFTKTFYYESYLHGSGHTPSLIVDFYWNFGYLGIFFGFILFGIVARTLLAYMVQYPKENGPILIYGLFITRIFGWIKAGSDTPTQMFLNFLIPIVIILILFSFKSKQ